MLIIAGKNAVVIVLDNLRPAEPVKAPKGFAPAVEFDGELGVATTPGLKSKPDSFDEFLADAGIDPRGVEIVGQVRTSKWQQKLDGDLVWLTAYRFHFKRKSQDVDLPLLLAEARKKVKRTPIVAPAEKCLVVSVS